MSDAIQKTEQPKQTTLAQFLEQRRESLAQIVPKHLSVDRLLKVALNSVSKNPALQKCSMVSVLQCVATCAELGLEPGGATGGAYLVPYKDACTLIIGYRGYVDLMRRSGQLSTVKALVVHERDKFRYSEGLETTLEHEPCLDGDPGPLRFVYCVLRLKDGGVQVEVMSKARIDAIKTEAIKKAWKPELSPWTNHYEEMARKTVIRRAAKLAPLSAEVVRAIEAEEDDFIDGEVVGQSAEVVADAISPAHKAVKRRLAIQDVPALPEESSQPSATPESQAESVA